MNPLLREMAYSWILVWQIAQRDYNFGKGKHRSLTKATYDAIGDHFRSLWGKEAGWAHSVLFTADLRAFSATQMIKPEVSEIKIEDKIEALGHIKPEVNELKTEGTVDECDHVYIKNETLPDNGLKRVMAGTSDTGAMVAEQLSTSRKVKRRRAR